jgi:transposase InsO family protein
MKNLNSETISNYQDNIGVLAKVWVVDTAIMTAEEGGCHIAVVTDSTNNEVIGNAMGTEEKVKLIQDALLMAKHLQKLTNPVTIEIDHDLQLAKRHFLKWCQVNRFNITYRASMRKSARDSLLRKAPGNTIKLNSIY